MMKNNSNKGNIESAIKSLVVVDVGSNHYVCDGVIEIDFKNKPSKKRQKYKQDIGRKENLKLELNLLSGNGSGGGLGGGGFC